MNSSLANYITRDLYTYVSEGMGYTLYEQPHRGMADFFEGGLPSFCGPVEGLESEQIRSMYLAPRETLKTSIGAQGLAEYYLVKAKIKHNYDARVLLIRATREDAQGVLGAVRQDLSDGNPVLQRAFGDLSQEAVVWTDAKIVLPWRDTVYREPSLDTASPGISRTGRHVDMVIIDDIANENNYMSELAMEQAKKYIQAMFPVMNSWGGMVVIGTRWGHNDPYGWILDQVARDEANGLDPLWRIKVESCYNEDGTLFYPAFLTQKALDTKRRTMDEKMFTACYLNVVSTDESQVFKESQMVFYEGDYTPRGWGPAELTVHSGNLQGLTIPVSCAIHIDPATSVADSANFTGISVVLTFPDGTRAVHFVWKGKEMPSDLISRILGYARYYLPYTLSIDVLGQQVLWVDRLRDALNDAGLEDITITQYKGKDGKVGKGLLSKAKRIESLEPLIREGKFIMHAGAVAPLVKEMKYYDGPTHANHFDLLDAVSHTMTVSEPPRTYEEYSEDLEDHEMELEFAGDKGEKVFVPGTWAGR